MQGMYFYFLVTFYTSNLFETDFGTLAIKAEVHKIIHQSQIRM